MKLMLLLFFAFTTPLTLLLATILYGGVTVQATKQALRESTVYTQIHEYLARQNTSTEEQTDVVTLLMKEQFSPKYIQVKTESAIDQSAAWISGKTSTEPRISFKELAYNLQQNQPELFAKLEHVPTKQYLLAHGVSEQQSDQYINQMQQISEFIKNDFTFSLTSRLNGIKLFYHYLQIAVPILVMILLLDLFMLGKFSPGMPAKTTWIGSALLISGFFGFGIVFFQSFLGYAALHLESLIESDYMTLVTPILNVIFKNYFVVYSAYQEALSSLFLFGAAVCFITAYITRTQTVTKIKPLNTKTLFFRKK